MKESNATPKLLNRLRTEMPEIWGQAQVVGRWVWLEFNVPPADGIRENLKKLGFHWNVVRKCWQHSCGHTRPGTGGDPRAYYQVASASAHILNDTPTKPYIAREYKVVSLRECALPQQMKICDNPDIAAEYWRLHVQSNPYFDPERECLVVVMLNTRKWIKGHQLVTIGTMDTLLVHPREIFRAAVVSSAAAILLLHNHPSGDPTPSEADIRITRDLMRAGQLLKIEVLDHVIIGNGRRSSLRELGYLYN